MNVNMHVDVEFQHDKEKDKKEKEGSWTKDVWSRRKKKRVRERETDISSSVTTYDELPFHAGYLKSLRHVIALNQVTSVSYPCIRAYSVDARNSMEIPPRFFCFPSSLTSFNLSVAAKDVQDSAVIAEKVSQRVLLNKCRSTLHCLSATTTSITTRGSRPTTTTTTHRALTTPRVHPSACRRHVMPLHKRLIPVHHRHRCSSGEPRQRHRHATSHLICVSSRPDVPHRFEMGVVVAHT